MKHVVKIFIMLGELLSAAEDRTEADERPLPGEETQ